METKDCTYIIEYIVFLNNNTKKEHTTKVKNCSSELVAKIKLGDYVKRKYKTEYKDLQITKCEKDIISFFSDIFGFKK